MIRNCVLALAVLFAGVNAVSAQISKGGTPASLTYELSRSTVETRVLPSLDWERIANDDAADEKQGNYPKIARFIEAGVSLEATDAWTLLDNGDRVWRYALRSNGALALSVQFEDFYMPRGAELFIYSADGTHTIGAFGAHNNRAGGQFGTQLVVGDEVIVEYIEPAASAGKGRFTITGVFHAYRMVPEAEAANRDFGDSEACQVNVNCPAGNNWQDEKRGVVRILAIEGNQAGWCSGSLVNNTAEDCSPYILTALHCGVNASASNMNQWVFYFNFEAAGCTNPGSGNALDNQTMTGCVRRADSDDNGGDNGSDYLLVELNSNVPESYNAFYNGWRRNNSGSTTGASIHHPAGDIKKISTYSTALQSTTWGGPAGSHWLVFWSANVSGFGVTEGGSSGSPIFDNQGLIIGTLTGGSSFCSQTNAPDLYGKMSYHWGSNPGDDLSVWLDPIGSGVNSLAGADNPCGGNTGGCTANIPYPETDPCVQTVILDDTFCCDSEWDATCQEAYDACNENNNPCVSVIPYPFSDPCVQQVILDDDFCCETEWDDVCEEAYQECVDPSPVDCAPGTVSSPLAQDVCPGEFGVFNASGVIVPTGGGYALGFVPSGGSGGIAGGFTLTEVSLPVNIDAGLGGLLAGNGAPNMAGSWTVVGVVYSNPNDLEGSLCGVTSAGVVFDFLSANDPDCATSVTELSTANAVVLFPNPANETLFITSQGNLGKRTELAIVNTVGQTVYRTEFTANGEWNHSIQLSDFAAGVYFVRFTNEDGSSVHRFIRSER